MQAYRAVATVGVDGELHVPKVPFSPGSVVEVIVLDAEPRGKPEIPRKRRRLSSEQEAALRRILSRSYSLGGRFPPRDELHER